MHGFFFINKLASKKRMTQHPGFLLRDSEIDETLQGVSPKRLGARPQGISRTMRRHPIFKQANIYRCRDFFKQSEPYVSISEWNNCCFSSTETNTRR
ncbi:hypothetical protein BCL52_0483 [Salisediminibacterium halotolerans]|nr:hypothetical protein BCL39_0484 [Actinophytocola xinjiangensis]RPE88642.1 hypothetical protein EDD67_0975 [Salisediminibacterium halotolerans]TWG36997.1 hypothetical protein BCL52_0483 [Salisediminibacterium halotolerans]